ncbi:hypothetical protein [Halorussus sp. MSC15.2]|uniref:hypothetical protein n=1 Tax=Halorussus sp. MSC15.2 TaxID=2283638 RepID=UPI0013D7A425|nr:hypothetical protein [Halorussus sp. MSC15.2]NEU58908.1 hypothetical protein [Halorussus sp. MSC15.2]
MSDRQTSEKRRTVLKQVGAASLTSVALWSGATAAESASQSRSNRGRRIENALSTVSDYLVLDSDLTITVEEKRAEEDGVTGFDRRVAEDFASLNNELAEIDFRSINDPSARSKRAEQLFRRFEPYFERIATGEATGKSIGRASKRLRQQWSGDVTTMDGGCGGTRDDPHPCPDRNWVSDSWNSKSEVQDHLKSEGYHQTAEYAAYGTDIDWTKVVDAYGCSGGPFRNQAIIQQRNGEWTYNTQGPEPNPEIHGYVWPSVDWGTYVEWWHSNHC